MRTMLRIETSGVVSEIAVPKGERLAEAIGCDLVDVIRTPDGVDLWVDDEGLINGSEPNVVA
jgi:hypothetical protein